jgi:hypothetical protein
MPLTGFICPDGGEIELDKCYKKCRMALRCATVPTCMAAASQRPWKGKVSTTQALSGTRCEYLKITRDYAVSVSARAFMVFGTSHHIKLEKAGLSGHLMEERLEDEGITGQFDALVEEDGLNTLYDYKTAGSWKICQSLGLSFVEQTTDEVYKSGPKKGQTKTKKVLVQGEPNLGDWLWQLNHYRLLLKAASFKVDRMFIQALVRDGGTYLAKQRGLDRNIYLIPIPFVDDDLVQLKFQTKKLALLKALEEGKEPPPCTDEETWNGRKCAEFCEVWESCSVGVAAHQKEEE